MTSRLRERHGNIMEPMAYIAPAMEHYRCMKCYVPLTRQKCVADTIQFCPNKIDLPALSINDHLLNALDTITSLLTHQNNPTSKQLLQLSPTNLEDLQTLATLLHRCEPVETGSQNNNFLQVNKLKKSSTTSIFSSKFQLDPQQNINNPTYQSVPHNLRNQNQNLQNSEYSTSSTLHKIPQNCGSTIHCTSEYVPLPVPNKDKQLPRVQSTSPAPQSTMAHIANNISTMCESTQGLTASTLKLPNPSKKHHRPSIRQTHAQIKRLPQKVQQRLYHKLTHIFDKLTGKKLTLRQLLQNPETTQIWSRSSSNKFGCLMNGDVYGTEGTNTMEMVPPTDVPKDKKSPMHPLSVTIDP